MKPLTILALLLCTFSAAIAQRTDTIFIHFDFDRSEVRPASAATLDSFFTPARKAGITRIELYGHCDSVGNHTYNDALSARRVESTKNYLQSKGFQPNIFVKLEGFGKRQPLNNNSSDEDRFMNRRVELIVHSTTEAVPEKKPAPSLTEIIKDTTAKGNIVLKNIQFQPGRHFLLPESQPTLDELFTIMRDNPTLVIEIQGHVCCTPDNEDGLDIDLGSNNLSVQRARAIHEHLVIRGIAPSRMTAVGFGGSRKLHPLERNDLERQENRRVELRIVKR